MVTTKNRHDPVSPTLDLNTALRPAWRTSNRVTIELVEGLPDDLWDAVVPGAPQRTVRMIAAHLHNSRCGWIRTLGREHGIAAPVRVDRWRVSRRQLVAALKRSSRGMEALLTLGFASGVLPPSKGYVWRNLPLDVGHVLTYFVAHEAHHRGQIVMVARQLNRRLPRTVVDGLWWWAPRRTARGDER
ncbi:MAG: DinB family protein [Vicinamibacterales bacterium]